MLLQSLLGVVLLVERELWFKVSFLELVTASLFTKMLPVDDFVERKFLLRSKLSLRDKVLMSNVLLSNSVLLEMENAL